MRPSERALPARMSRVAIVAPADRLRETLVSVADAGTVELAGTLPGPSGDALEALRRLQRDGGGKEPRLAPDAPDVAALERSGAADLLAGEVEVSRRADAAIRHGSFAALVGWTPTAELPPLRSRLSAVGATAVELPRPSWVEPPTLLAPRRLARPFRPLVETYGAARYADLDPTLFATVSFVLMFGMMFGDVGHGLLLAALALVLRGPAGRRFPGARALWPLPFAAGLVAAVFGLLYGEAFGPSGLVPTLWLDPVDEPIPLLAAAVAVGAALLANSYAIGIVNRWREEGLSRALVSPSAIAGFLVFLGGGLAGLGWYVRSVPLGAGGGALAVAGIGLLVLGFVIEAGRGALAVGQAAIESVDAVIRVGSSAISFTRLAAFGLMHAAVSTVVWDAAAASWGTVPGTIAAVAVFLVGNALAFSLEVLVTGIQALRLEYFELFSRIFAGQGHVFAPWRIPLASPKEES